MVSAATDSTLATLQKLQGQLPPHLARRDLAELSVLLRYAERGAWAFAIYNTVPVRDEVAGVLQELLAPLPVYRFTLSTQQPNPLEYLNQCVPSGGRAIVFFFDLEQTGGAVWDHLELQRENLAAWPLGLVFWINSEAWGEGVRRAPNFWSQRSGVFDFRIESPAVVTEVRSAWAGQPVWLDSPDDWDRQMRLFSGLLREYQAEDAPPAARAELHGKLAYLLDFAGRYDEAIAHLEQQLSLAQAAGDRAQQVRALNNLGRVAQIQEGCMAALDWYTRALAAAGDDPRARAESLQNMAAALFREGEAERARAMLHEALDLFRAVGDRLGEANTRKAIGDVQRFQDDNQAALQSYAQALALFRAVGDRLGEANPLKAIGDVHNFRKEIDAALDSYQQALALFRAVGDRLGEANTLKAIGDVQQFRDERDAALDSYQQALALFRAVGDRLGEANVLLAIAPFAAEPAQAFAEAILLYEKIGDRYSVARGLYYFGLWLLGQDRPDEARHLLSQSRDIFQALNMPQVAAVVESTLESTELMD